MPAAPRDEPTPASTSRPQAWFWCAVAVGLLARLYLALVSAGTADVGLWSRHAAGVATEGLVAHYARDRDFNHPPFMSYLMAAAWDFAYSCDIRFEQLYRVPIVLADLGSAALLWLVLRGHPRRELLVAAYCLAPVAIVLTGQHGNTDALIATCLLGCTLFAAGGRPVATGLLLGFSAWIKLPGLFAAPAIGFALPRWRDRFVCAGVALSVAAFGYSFAYLEAASFAAKHPELVPVGHNVLVDRVFGYRGLFIQTRSDPPTWAWGFKIFFFEAFGLDFGRWPGWARWYVDNSFVVALGAVLLLAFLRRRERTALGLGVTIAFSYALFYGLIETWTFQYFAWSMPFWMLAGTSFAVATNLVGGGYIYGLYAYVCSDLLLRSEWDFAAHPVWPEWLLLLRVAAFVTFVGLGLAGLGRAMLAEFAALRAAR